MPTLALTIQQLEYLVAIDRAGTWAEAAASVGVTPSALSQGVAELERRLGVALFERDGRRRVPTRDHAEVLRYASATVAGARGLARWLDRRRGASVGEVRVGMIDAAATHHFGGVLRAYRRHRPDVSLRLTVAPSAELLARLVAAELDLAVCVRPAVDPEGVSVEPLFDDPLAVLAPAGEGASAAGWGPWVTFPVGSHTRAIVASSLERRGARFEVVAESHQPEVLRQMVRLGIGWTVLPLAGSGDLDDVEVIETSLTTRPLVLARRTAAAPDPVADELADDLRRR